MPNKEVSNFVVWSLSATTIPIWTKRFSCKQLGSDNDKFGVMRKSHLAELESSRQITSIDWKNYACHHG
jgi:hypothetical protein